MLELAFQGFSRWALCGHAGKTHFCPHRPFWGLEGTQVMGTNQDSYGLHKAGVSIRKHQVPEKGEAATLNWKPVWLVRGFDLFKMPPVTDMGLIALLVHKKKCTALLKHKHLMWITTEDCMPKLISRPVGRSSASAAISCTPSGFSGRAAPLGWAAWAAGWYQRKELSKYPRPSSSSWVTKIIKPFLLIKKALSE